MKRPSLFLPPAAPFLPAAERTIPRSGARNTPLPPDSVPLGTGRFLKFFPPAAPFLSAAKEMGERTPPKTDGFWISFRPISMRQEKAPQGIGHESTRAAADVVVTRDWRVYRFGRLSNRALAAAGGKCMCGPLGRGKFKIMVHRSVEKRPQHCSAAVGCGTILRHVGAAAGIEVQAIRCGTFLRRDCKRTKGIPKTMGLWRRFCILLPPWAKGCRAGARNTPLAREYKTGCWGRRPLRGARTGPRQGKQRDRPQPLRGVSVGVRRRIRTGKEKIIS